MAKDFLWFSTYLEVVFIDPEERKMHPNDPEIRKVFKEHLGRYGSPRIQAELKRRGMDCSRYQVEKRMKILGLYWGKKKRKPKATTSQSKEKKDLLNRDFPAKRPNEKWCA